MDKNNKEEKIITNTKMSKGTKEPCLSFVLKEEIRRYWREQESQTKNERPLGKYILLDIVSLKGHQEGSQKVNQGNGRLWN